MAHTPSHIPNIIYTENYQQQSRPATAVSETTIPQKRKADDAPPEPFGCPSSKRQSLMITKSTMSPFVGSSGNSFQSMPLGYLPPPFQTGFSPFHGEMGTAKRTESMPGSFRGTSQSMMGTARPIKSMPPPFQSEMTTATPRESMSRSFQAPRQSGKSTARPHQSQGKKTEHLI